MRIRPRFSCHAETVLLVVVGYLLVAYTAIVVVDIVGLGGFANRFDEGVWTHLFTEAGPTEIFQWGLLGAAALISAALHGRLRGRDDQASRFWLLLGIALLLMLIEDAGNVRHTLNDYTTLIAGFADLPAWLVRTATELSYYGLLAAIPLYAFVRYRHAFWPFRRVRNLILGGYATYGVAAAASATRFVGNSYVRVGSFLEERVFLGRLPEVERVAAPGEPPAPTGFWVMDFLVEETLELLAAALLCASAIAYTEVLRARHAGASTATG